MQPFLKVMETIKINTENQILRAAEEIFLKKGFKSAKISDIAELAGVNNALINYYFRTKEKLFNKVLQSKIELLATSLSQVIEPERSFGEVITNLVETQFDFFNNNTMLPRFILSEVLTDKDRIKMFRETIIPIVLNAAKQLDQRLQEEISAGRVRHITMFDLLYTLTSLNILSFVIAPIFSEDDAHPIAGFFAQVMEERKQKNVDTVMSYLTNTKK